MDLLRQKIKDYDSLLPHEFTIKRDEVNFFLKKVLSSRELDVFMLLLKGFSNHKIAEQLFVSVNTVKFHLQNIYVKLDVKNRAEAVLCVSKG
jgi:ATP/maltotriose-dependent transcriptional regulator MalT